jgi:hypothetical protein
MYQFSLEWFIRLFIASIAAAPAPKKQLVARLKSVIETFTKTLYLNVCRSLFERDKLLFSLLLTLRILVAEGGVSEDESRYLLTGSTAIELLKPNPGKRAATSIATAQNSLADIASSHEIGLVKEVEEEGTSDSDEDKSKESGRERAESQRSSGRPATAGRVSATGTGASSKHAWLTDGVWNNIVGLTRLPGGSFVGIDDEIAAALDAWREVATSAAPAAAIADLLAAAQARVDGVPPETHSSHASVPSADGQKHSPRLGPTMSSASLVGAAGAGAAAVHAMHHTLKRQGSGLGGIRHSMAGGLSSLTALGAGAGTGAAGTAPGTAPGGAALGMAASATKMTARSSHMLVPPPAGSATAAGGPPPPPSSRPPMAPAHGAGAGTGHPPLQPTNRRGSDTDRELQHAALSAANLLHHGGSSAASGKANWDNLTMFQHLLLLHCLRPDKLVPAVQVSGLAINI